MYALSQIALRPLPGGQYALVCVFCEDTKQVLIRLREEYDRERANNLALQLKAVCRPHWRWEKPPMEVTEFRDLRPVLAVLETQSKVALRREM